MVDFHAVISPRFGLSCCILLILADVLITGQTIEDNEDKVHNEWRLRNENPCLAAGGICVVEKYCEEEFKDKKGLCPEQEPNGGICCHKVPKIATCEESGGFCTEDCKIEDLGQKNCSQGKTCCPLVY